MNLDARTGAVHRCRVSIVQPGGTQAKEYVGVGENRRVQHRLLAGLQAKFGLDYGCRAVGIVGPVLSAETQHGATTAIDGHLAFSDLQPAGLQLKRWCVARGLFRRQIGRQAQGGHSFPIEDTKLRRAPEHAVRVGLLTDIGEQRGVGRHLGNGQGGSGHDHLLGGGAPQPLLEPQEGAGDRQIATGPVGRLARLRTEE